MRSLSLPAAALTLIASTAKAAEPAALRLEQRIIHTTALQVLGEAGENIPTLCPETQRASLMNLGEAEEGGDPIQFYTENPPTFALATVATTEDAHSISVAWNEKTEKGFSVETPKSDPAKCIRSAVVRMNKEVQRSPKTSACKIEIVEKPFTLPNGNPLVVANTELINGYFMSFRVTCTK